MQCEKHAGYSRYPRYCPVCSRGRVVDVSVGDIEIRLLKPGQDEQAVLFVKCPKCKNQIGIGLVVA